MNTLRLRLLQGGLALGALLFTAVASADQGTVILVTGQVVVGEVTQVVTGEYIMVTLPSGEVKAIAWAQIGSFQIGGSATVSTGNPTVAPPPAPAPAPAPTYTPPPPPPPNYGYGYGYGEPPPPPPPPPPAFTPTWMLGVRLGSLSPSGDVTSGRSIKDYASSGWSFEGDIGMHLSPAFTMYGFWEHGALGRGAQNTLGVDNSAMNTVGGGMNVNSAGRGPVGFLFDAALGYRWFGFSHPTVYTDPNTFISSTTYNKATAEGVVVRLGMGLAINATKKFRIDLLGHVTWGSFREFKGGGLEGSEPGSHSTWGLSAGGRWDL